MSSDERLWLGFLSEDIHMCVLVVALHTQRKISYYYTLGLLLDFPPN
jgi:hypothetical protein